MLNKSTKIIIGIMSVIVTMLIAFIIVFAVMISKSKKKTSEPEKFEDNYMISNFDTRNFGPLNFPLKEYNKDAEENELLMQNGFKNKPIKINNEEEYDKAINLAIVENNKKITTEQKKLNSLTMARMNEAVPSNKNCKSIEPISENKFIEAASEQTIKNEALENVGSKYKDYLTTIQLDDKDLAGQKTWNDSIGNFTGNNLMFDDIIDESANVKTYGMYGFNFATPPTLEGFPIEHSENQYNRLGQDPYANNGVF